MNVKIKRIDKSLPLPDYQTKGSVAFDLYSREDRIIKPGKIDLLPSNFIIESPEGYMLMVAPRSSTPKKKGLSFPHSVGIIDQDYSGQEDEILILVKNITDDNIKITAGERIAQGVFVKIEKAQWDEIDEINKPMATPIITI